MFCLFCTGCITDYDSNAGRVSSPNYENTGFEHAVITVENAEVSPSKFFITGKIHNPTDEIIFIPMAYSLCFENEDTWRREYSFDVFLKDKWANNLKYKKSRDGGTWKNIPYYFRFSEGEVQPDPFYFYALDSKGYIQFKFYFYFRHMPMIDWDMPPDTPFKFCYKGAESNVFTIKKVKALTCNPWEEYEQK